VTPFIPSVAPEIWQRYPEYRALSVLVRNFQHAAVDGLGMRAPQPPPWMAEHLDAWREAFRSFGANPKKTPCSVEALWKRVQKGGELPLIDPVVDLYNGLSIRFGACFGGEDLDRYAGPPQLVAARGDELFDTVRDGAPLIEQPEPGEIVWRDDLGVTCRRWNWRQCKRTALGGESRNLWFIIDRLPPMPIAELERAGEELVAGLGRLSPGLTHSIQLISPA
jgi:DNA/RNA-binding domain of Phe-tRNA-synthetase-like protein